MEEPRQLADDSELALRVSVAAEVEMRCRQLAAQRSLIKLLGRTILEPNTGEVRKVVRLKSDFPKLLITAGKEKLLSAEHFLVSLRC